MKTRTEILALKKTLEIVRGAILSVLCNPEGHPCFKGSDEDRAVIASALAAIEEATK